MKEIEKVINKHMAIIQTDFNRLANAIVGIAYENQSGSIKLKQQCGRKT